VGLAAAALACAIGAGVAYAYAPVGSDFRISNVGTDTDADRGGVSPSVAYNSTANEYLVTWRGDGLATDGEDEIFGQRLSAAGAELGTDFRISSVGTDTDAARGASDPSVAYSSTANEYLVAWQGDGLATDNEFEIFGQRLGAAGAELGTDFRISSVGTDADAARDGFSPSVAYNSSANQYLVTWRGDGLATDNENEIFGQRLSAAGAELGADFRISSVGTDTDATRGGFSPSVAYNSSANQYLVSWYGDGLATDDEVEIFGQRLGAAGAELGLDLRISTVGTDTDAARAAVAPSAAYSSSANEYLVSWWGDGLATDDEFEIFGHRLALAATPPAAATPPPPTPAAKKKCKKKKSKKGKKGAGAAKKCKKKKKK
jgi:predicted nucleic acid-binding protein